MMDAYTEGRVAYEEYNAGLCHNRDNPYCMEDPRWTDFERGLMDAYEEDIE